MPANSSAVIDTRVIPCGDNLDQLRKLPDGCVDLIHIDPPFNSNRNYEVFWGETKEKRSFDGSHESTTCHSTSRLVCRLSEMSTDPTVSPRQSRLPYRAAPRVAAAERARASCEKAA